MAWDLIRKLNLREIVSIISSVFIFAHRTYALITILQVVTLHKLCKSPLCPQVAKLVDGLGSCHDSKNRVENWDLIVC